MKNQLFQHMKSNQTAMPNKVCLLNYTWNYNFLIPFTLKRKMCWKKKHSTLNKWKIFPPINCETIYITILMWKLIIAFIRRLFFQVLKHWWTTIYSIENVLHSSTSGQQQDQKIKKKQQKKKTIKKVKILWKFYFFSNKQSDIPTCFREFFLLPVKF